MLGKVMKRLLIASVLVIAVSVVAGEKCHGGSAFWCANEANAQLCNKMNYCLNHVWQVNDFGEKNGVIIQKNSQAQLKEKCTYRSGLKSRASSLPIWQIIFGGISSALFQDVLNGGNLWDGIRKIMDGTCSLFPCSYDKRCYRVVDSIFTDPDAMIFQRGVNMPEKSICEVCRTTAGLLKNYMDMDTMPEIVDNFLLPVICDMNIVPVPNCNELVEKYFGIGWNILKQMLDSGDACDVVHLCKSPSTNQDGTCNICNIATNAMRPYMDDSMIFQNNIKNVLKIFCLMMSEHLGHNSTALVRRYFDKCWDSINDINRDEICTLLGMCKPLTSRSLKKIVQLRALQISSNDISDMAINFMKSIVEKILNILNSYYDKMGSSLDKGMDGLCKGCELVVLYIKSFFENKNEAIDTLCTWFPDDYEDVCSFLLSFHDLGFAILEPVIKSEGLCTKIKVCVDPSQTPSLKKI